MKKFKLPLLSLLLLVSTHSFACGTINNWMDVYQGTGSEHPWRDKSSRLDALTMMLSCGDIPTLDESEQVRLLGILTDAMMHKETILMQGSGNHDLTRNSLRYGDSFAFEALVESVYHRFSCLAEVRNKSAFTFRTREKGSGKTLYEYFGTAWCEQEGAIRLQVKAPSGSRLRSAPSTESNTVVSLKDGVELLVLGKNGDWYRVANPYHDNWQVSHVGYIHRSIVERLKP